jgi:hypothetical protein
MPICSGSSVDLIPPTKSDFHLSRSCEVGLSTEAKSVTFTSPA